MADGCRRAIAGVLPVSGAANQTSGDWVVVHVVQLLDALVVRKDVEVVVARKPERSLKGQFGNRKLQRLQS